MKEYWVRMVRSKIKYEKCNFTIQHRSFHPSKEYVHFGNNIIKIPSNNDPTDQR